MLSALFSSLGDYFRSQIFDDSTGSAMAQASHFDTLADAERAQEAFQQTDMFDHSNSGFDHSSGFDHGSSFGSDSFGSDSWSSSSSSFD